MPFALAAEGFRVATLHAELTRKGPGLLLRDIERGGDKQIDALALLVGSVKPDVLFLTKVDFDLEQRAANALRDVLGFSHMFALAPNSMKVTQLDLDGNGRAEDRQAWARYAGEGAMLLLSQHPFALRFHLNDVLWSDVQGAQMPVAGFLDEEAASAIKVVTQGFWVLDLLPEDHAPMTFVAFQNSAPVFDGPEDLNGLRNRAQLGLLNAVMDGKYGMFPKKRFVLIGNSNLDPQRGEGDRAAMSALLADKRLQDPRPRSEIGGETTAQWETPGAMRVSYILPSAEWELGQTAVVWPRDGPLRAAAEQASRHRMVWMELTPAQE